jgi:hypothetical protein
LNERKNAINKDQLFTAFLGLTEKRIDANPPFGSALKKTGKKDLDANMQIISYSLSQIQYFEVIIDKDQENIVVGQKTYWTDLDHYYQVMKAKALPLRCGYSDGFYVSAPQFGKVLFEIVALQGNPRCIMTSI